MKKLFTFLAILLVSTPLSFGQDRLPWKEHPFQMHINQRTGWTGSSTPPRYFRVLDPADPANAWYTVGAGGIWHTHDLGITQRQLPTTGVNSLTFSKMAVAHNRPHILVAITGESSTGTPKMTKRTDNVPIPGNGVYWSGNRGMSWRHLTLDMSTEDLRYLEDVAISGNGDTIMVASHYRVMRSADAGQTWEEVLQIAKKAGTTSYHSSPRTQILVSPQNMQHVYIEAYRDSTVKRHPRPPNCPGSCVRDIQTHTIYQSTDGGDSWHTPDMFNSGNTVNHPEEEEWEIVFSPAQPGLVWALSQEREIFRSENYGTTWDSVQISWDGGESVIRAFRPWNRAIVPHPTNPDILFTGSPAYLSGRRAKAVYRNGRLTSLDGRETVESGSSFTPNEILLPHDSDRGYKYIRDGDVPFAPARISW